MIRDAALRRPPTRRLYIEFEITDSERRVRCTKVISHDLLQAARDDVGGSILLAEVEEVIRSCDLEWDREPEEKPA